MTLVHVEDRGGIAVVRMDRAPANALSPDFLDASLEAIDDLNRQRPGAVVLTGTDAFFSGGADLKLVPTLGADDQVRMARGSNALFKEWYALRRPLVCAVNGHAVAGGLVLALCGDVRISGNTGRFGLTEVKVGIPYPPSAMAVVQAELTPSAARRLVLRGELFDASTMLELGVFDEVVEDGSVLSRALEIAGQMRDLPHRSFEVIKHSLRRAALKRSEDQRSETQLGGWLSSETAEASAAVIGRQRTDRGE